MINMGIYYRFVLIGFGVCVTLLSFSVGTPKAEEVYDCEAEENRKKTAQIEITLSKKLKKKKKEVEQALQSSNEKVLVRVKFFPFLDPPLNIGIGKCIPAELARLAIIQATAYNGGVTHLILQNVLPHHWIGIGTTHLAELSWMPVTPEQLERLKDPSLSTKEFHAVYGELAVMKEKMLPFGLDPIPYPLEK